MRSLRISSLALLAAAAVTVPQPAHSQGSFLKNSEPQGPRFEAYLPPLPATPWWLETVGRNPQGSYLPSGSWTDHVGSLALQRFAPDTQIPSNVGTDAVSSDEYPQL